jgi:hypothetical protein
MGHQDTASYRLQNESCQNYAHGRAYLPEMAIHLGLWCPQRQGSFPCLRSVHPSQGPGTLKDNVRQNTERRPAGLQRTSHYNHAKSSFQNKKETRSYKIKGTVRMQKVLHTKNMSDIHENWSCRRNLRTQDCYIATRCL